MKILGGYICVLQVLYNSISHRDVNASSDWIMADKKCKISTFSNKLLSKSAIREYGSTFISNMHVKSNSEFFCRNFWPKSKFYSVIILLSFSFRELRKNRKTVSLELFSIVVKRVAVSIACGSISSRVAPVCRNSFVIDLYIQSRAVKDERYEKVMRVLMKSLWRSETDDESMSFSLNSLYFLQASVIAIGFRAARIANWTVI